MPLNADTFDSLRATISSLREDNERLRGALTVIELDACHLSDGSCEWVETDASDGSTLVCPGCIARHALSTYDALEGSNDA